MKRMLVAKSAGFCFGVKRAVELAEKALGEGPCWSLGQLIHNDAVVARLESMGLSVAASPEDIPAGSTVIIRSHGEPRAVHEHLVADGNRIVDATCPKVARIHRIVSQADAEGRLSVVIGSAGHPEIQAICGWCLDSVVLSNAEEVKGWLSDNPEMRHWPLTVVFQTTQTQENLEECVKIFKKECTNLKMFDTICGATSLRQSEAAYLSSKCDVMVVIGSKHSANSMHLAEICAERCGKTLFIEDASEFDTALLTEADTVGITAGASAPAWIIKEVKQKMSDEIKIEEMTAEPAVAEESAQAAEVEETTQADEAGEPVQAAEAGEAAQVSAPDADFEAEKASAETEEAAPVAEVAQEAPAEAETQVEEAPAAEEKPDSEKSFEELLEDSIKTIYNGETVTGIVAAITATEISVDLGTKHSGYIPVSEFADDPEAKIEDIIKVGDKIEASVVRVNDIEGTVMLSKKRLDAVKNWSDIEAAQGEGTAVEGVVTEDNKGGVVVNVKGVRVFVPASQTGLGKDVPMNTLIKQKVRLKITEVNRSRRRVVGSIRAIQFKERKERADKVWSEIEVGKRYKGVVKSLTSYGAFVDIGGIDGMVHVSELSWSRINRPADVVSVGDEIEVYVISFDKETRKISLGYKDPDQNPWKMFTDKYEVGSVVNVKIVKLMPFGAFAEVLPGVDGLIHISQIANRRIGKPDEVLTVGEYVDVKITAIDDEKQKISLSIRVLSEPERASSPPAEEKSPAKPYASAAAEEDALVYEISETGTATGLQPHDSEAE